MNQEFEIVRDETLVELEIKVRSKIKSYNERGYTCISQSIIQEKGLLRDFAVSLLFEPTRAAFGV